MEIIAFTLVWVLMSGSTFANSVRSGGASFVLHMRVTRPRDTFLYWCTVLFWFCAFGFTSYAFASLSLHALKGTDQFRSRGFWPVTSMQWVLAALDVFFLLAIAYFGWRKVQLRRLLREIEAEEKSRA